MSLKPSIKLQLPIAPSTTKVLTTTKEMGRNGQLSHLLFFFLFFKTKQVLLLFLPAFHPFLAWKNPAQILKNPL